MSGFFEGYADRVKREIEQFLDREETGLSPGGLDIIRRFRRFSTAGKALRGALVLAFHDRYSGREHGQALKTAAGIELLHSAILVIDDIIDSDELRRGIPTMHVQLEGYMGTAANGRELAMCVGLAGTYLGFQMMAGVKPAVIDLVSRCFSLTSIAEIIEIMYSAGRPVKVEDVLELYRMKTGRYTVALPAQAGAMLAGAPEDDLRLIEKIGDELGIIFQLKDDVLELEGSDEQIGKSAISDIRAGRKTLAYLLLTERCRPEEKAQVEKFFGKGAAITAADAGLIRELYKKYRVAEAITDMADERLKAVKDLMEKLSVPASVFNELIEYNRKRTY